MLRLCLLKVILLYDLRIASKQAMLFHVKIDLYTLQLAHCYCLEETFLMMSIQMLVFLVSLCLIFVCDIDIKFMFE